MGGVFRRWGRVKSISHGGCCFAEDGGCGRSSRDTAGWRASLTRARAQTCLIAVDGGADHVDRRGRGRVACGAAHVGALALSVLGARAETLPAAVTR